MHLRFSDTAEADLDKIYTEIARDNPIAARRVVDALLGAAYQLENFPFLGRPGRVPQTRELSVPRTPYFMVYTLPDEFHIDIETIIHERQQFPPISD
jgi:toxin ParE1/3/4